MYNYTVVFQTSCIDLFLLSAPVCHATIIHVFVYAPANFANISQSVRPSHPKSVIMFPQLVCVRARVWLGVFVCAGGIFHFGSSVSSYRQCENDSSDYTYTNIQNYLNYKQQNSIQVSMVK